MKTDKELLELAALAFGITDGEWRDDYTGDYYYDGNTWGVMYLPENGNWTVWNPLTDDGDALRLALKMRLKIDIRAVSVTVEPYIFNKYAETTFEFFEDDEDLRAAATRRAIVRAAAAIGEKL